MKKLLLIILLIPMYSQWMDPKDVTLAKEVWSEPVILDPSFAGYYLFEDYPTLNQTLDTIYYCCGGINFSYKKEGKWQKPVNLIKDGTIRGTSLSKNGKRLYFSGWGGYGSWDLWYMDWDSEKKQWSQGKNMGPEINSSWGDYYIYEINPDTLYVIRENPGSQAAVGYYYNKENKKWTMYLDDFIVDPNEAGHPVLYWGDIHGISITGDRKKMYFAKYFWPDYTNKEKESLLMELFVSYKDSKTKKWGKTYSLNINTKAIKVDTVLNKMVGGGDYYPWISPDGRTLFFCGNRNKVTDTLAWKEGNNTGDIYVSYLLKDENGDTVTPVEKTEEKQTERFHIEPNYPNPFNSETTIRYKLNREENIIINLYDSLGKKVVEIYRGFEKSGEHEIRINAAKYNMSSGVYYCTIISGMESHTIKLIYLK